MESDSLSPYRIDESLYINKNNPHKERLLHTFTKLMETDLYGLGI